MSLDFSTTLRPTKTLGLGIWDVQLDRRDESSSQSQSFRTSTASSTGSGCVTCSGTPACPVCAEDEQCALSLQRCDQCAQTYCAKKNGALGSGSSSSPSSSAAVAGGSSSKSSNSGKVGGIVGGVVGGVGLIVVLLLLYLYLKFWRKNRTRNKEVLVAHEHYGDDFEDGRGPSGNSRSNSYIQERDSLYQPRNRSSAATQITKASNILPIAYIPGVTAGGRSQSKLPPLPRHLLRNGDTRSHITLGSSILGGDDDNDIEADGLASSQREHANESTPEGSRDALTTAIRARPKLVQINEEEDEEPVEKETDFGDQEHVYRTSETHRENEKEPWITTAVVPSSCESSRQEDTHGDEHRVSSEVGDDDDDDDDGDDSGSFILDVGME
ncbi:LAFA_0G11034g1_1 [Lachancea sp. 'fantastica']|nr:LAFA_0G11034g1_1 [Lachancea sp. 'fantastica']